VRVGRPSLCGGARCEGICRYIDLGRFLVVQIVLWSAHSWVWQRDGACLDDNRGEMRGGRGGLWEEMKGDMRRDRGSDLHDAKREQGRRRVEMSKPK
jgi:hypothetical protein